MIYETNALLGGEITAFLWHTLVYMFPSLSASAHSQYLFFCLRVPPSLHVPCLPLAVYHCIFLLIWPDSAPIPI